MSDDVSKEALLKEVRELRRKERQYSQIAQSNAKLTEQYQQMLEEQKKDKVLIRELKTKCLKMENILILGNTSTVATLINQFVGLGVPILKQIVVEVHLADFDKTERKNVAEFIQFLDDTSFELKKLLSFPSFAVSDSASKKQVKQIATNVKASLNNLVSSLERFESDQIRMIASELDEFLKFLDSFQMEGPS